MTAQDPSAGRTAAGWLGPVFAALITGVIATAFGISFTAIIYNGPLAEYLSQGIALTLIGSGIMAGLAPFLLSYKGTVFHAQDVTAILIGIAATSIAGSRLADGTELFPTIAMLVVSITILTGIILFFCGRFRLGFIARFAPYPVLGGFLAATGYLLTVGAIGMILRLPLDIWSLGQLFYGDSLVRWVPWLAVSAAIVFISRMIPGGLVLPAGLAISGIGFYVVLFLADIPIGRAMEMGLLLGPFESDTFLDTVNPNLPFLADWGAIAGEMPTFIAVAAMAFLGTLLNASGIELTIRRDLDFERELTSSGIANVAGGLGGGMVGYHTIGETVFLNRLGLVTVAGGLSVVAFHAVVLVFGANIIAILPVGLIAAVIGYLGIDLLVTWLWDERRRLPVSDFAIVLLILTVAATIGFLQALTLGLLAAALLFILSYARTDVVRLRTTLATRRSSVERGPAELTLLAERGKSAVVFELTGYLFFGTANALNDRLREELDAPGIDAVLIDFRRVPGIDASAAFSLSKLAEQCERQGASLHLSGMNAAVGVRFDRVISSDQALSRHATLDEALLALETRMLVTHQGRDVNEDFPGRLAEDHPDVDLTKVLERRSLVEGDVLIEQGSLGQELYALISGELRAEVAVEGARKLTVARFQPGALVGEIAYYANAPRTASVIADRPSEVLALNLAAIPDTPEGKAMAADIHAHAASYLSRRLMRMTQLMRDAGH